MRLVAASLDPPEGLEAFLLEVGDGEFGFGTDFAPGAETLDDFLQRQLDNANGVNMPPGWVRRTTFWLLDNNDAIAGISHLRHELNDVLRRQGGHIGYYVRPAARGKRLGTSILALTLAEGRKLGIERFLLTVDAENVPSIRVIEGNGGVLENEGPHPETGRPYRRYWIG